MGPKLKKSTEKTNSYGSGSSKKKRKAQLLAARSKRIQKGSSTPEPTDQLDTPPPLTQPSAIVQEQPVTLSASKRKLTYSAASLAANEGDSTHKLPSTIADLESLTALFSGILCPYCLQPSLILCGNTAKNSGLAIYLQVTCTICNKTLTSTYTSKKCDEQIFDVNRRAVASACATGMGHAGLCNFSELMNIPSLHHKTFNTHTKTIKDKCDSFSQDYLARAVEEVKRAYPEQSDPVKNINVSFDGSWHKRGHTSKSGIGLVIEKKTGLIIDYEVLTSYCPTCATTGSKLQKQNILRYERWYAAHQPSCEANYDGPSGGMEKEAALRMWSRSVLKNGLRYVTMISDGDAKTIGEIHTLDPYPGITVEKHECVNHVGKRLGTALRNLVATKSKEKRKVTLGGKGYGKLRPEVITQLQAYYSNAIRKNATVPEMKKAILAIIDHCSSTDDAPHHDSCPTGDDSWCFFKRAQTRGLAPGPHKESLRTPLCPLVADNIWPIFERMASDELLTRCLLQATQNTNESAHSVIWARCPKHLFATRNRLSIAVALGVAEYNFGSAASHKYRDSKPICRS